MQAVKAYVRFCELEIETLDQTEILVRVSKGERQILYSALDVLAILKLTREDSIWEVDSEYKRYKHYEGVKLAWITWEGIVDICFKHPNVENSYELMRWALIQAKKQWHEYVR